MNQQDVSSIGRQLARYRKAAKLSGEELAEKAGAGLTRSVIANLENGRKNDVTVTQLMALAAALHVPPALLIADVFAPGAESPYPLPEYNLKTFDSKARELVEATSLARNSELIAWIGGQSFRTTYPVKFAATKLANDAYLSVTSYSRAWSSFIAAAARYSSALNHDSGEYAAHTESTLQHEALAVISAIDSMRRADVAVSDEAEARVYMTLSDLGLTYNPDVGSLYMIPDADG